MNSAGRAGNTALHFAAKQGQFELVKLLIGAGRRHCPSLPSVAADMCMRVAHQIRALM